MDDIKAESKKIGLGVQNCGKMNVEMCLEEKIIGKNATGGKQQLQHNYIHLSCL